MKKLVKVDREIPWMPRSSGCKIKDQLPFESNTKSFERGLFAPEEARRVATMCNHRQVYDEALRQVLGTLSER